MIQDSDSLCLAPLKVRLCMTVYLERLGEARQSLVRLSLAISCSYRVLPGRSPLNSCCLLYFFVSFISFFCPGLHIPSLHIQFLTRIIHPAPCCFINIEGKLVKVIVMSVSLLTREQESSNYSVSSVQSRRFRIVSL